MTSRDRLLAATVVLLWGVNFLAIRVGLDHLPPFFFAALRFAVIAVPALLLIPRPPARWRWILLYGTGFGILQFAFLFTAMRIGMPTGLASLVLQSSAPFTVILGALLLRERLRPVQVGGLLFAVAGMAVIGWNQFAHAALLPVLLTLAAGFGWALGNIGARQASVEAPGSNPLHLTLWITTVPVLPLLAISAVWEGPTTGVRALLDTFTADGWPALVALGYTAVLATVVGSGMWTYLMSRYPAGSVAPLSLLVPVVGFTAAWIFLGETPASASLIGGAVVIAGAFAATAGARKPTGAKREIQAAAADAPRSGQDGYTAQQAVISARQAGPAAQPDASATRYDGRDAGPVTFPDSAHALEPAVR
ncbi:EamA family transporter [Nocardia carnea]|uniref:EamA family transporter n=1 Tax=Nocardia carnea TaxID=37328 RepID=UPI002457EA3E|nr:EamA family transporter [Nocardia carnea]